LAYALGGCCTHLLGFDTPAPEPFKRRGQAGRGGSIGIDVSETGAERVLWDHDIGRLRSFERPELARQYGSWGKDFFRNGQIDIWRPS